MSMNTMNETINNNATPYLDVAVVGAGFGGIGLGVKLKQAGVDNFRIFEQASDVGGVWRDNIYPGAACDVPSQDNLLARLFLIKILFWKALCCPLIFREVERTLQQEVLLM